MAITSVKIFPSIGIARLGNSPELFVGPERPGDRPIPAGGYRDAHCRIKRQAARFRLFGFDGNTLVGEITLAEADEISWTVHLANKKASWKKFDGLNGNAALRNAGVADRASLEIDPGARTLDGPNQAAGFNTGRFLNKVVPLGEMRTDAEGRLLVTGGFGSSGSVPAGQPIVHYANNDLWHDDVSDGPVTATVVMGGEVFQAAPAWVLCGPPDFAPPLDSLTTLYDTLFQVAVDEGWLSVPATPSFTKDVFPILQRIFDLARASSVAGAGHFDFDGSSAAAMSAARRQSILSRLRDPDNVGAPGAANMPKLWDDNNDKFLTVTKAQYEILEKWKDGNFTADWPGSPPPPPAGITPEGLTEAALGACVGAAFFPGIEASWFLRDTYGYLEPYRLDPAGRAAGDVTKQMAVPWQADFWKCQEYSGYAWWPAQRPDEVFPEGGGGADLWAREIVFDHQDMVDHWHKLGFVVRQGGQLVETQRVKVCLSLTLVTDRSHFGKDEVDAAIAGSSGIFEDVFYVIAEGFLPSELGVTQANPTPAQLAGFAPAVTLKRPDNSPAQQMSATPRQLLLQDGSLPANLRQRFTFVYRVTFTGTADFFENGNPVDRTIAVTATKGSRTAGGSVFLFHQPNPYMTDGPTSWLSTDVRVFQIQEQTSRFGFNIGSDAAAATTFIGQVVNSFNGLGLTNHPFDTIATDQQASRLELSEKVGTRRVFNFAVARVRYRGQTLDANGVRVFFRLFTTAATGLDFNETSTYRRTPGATPVALLGLQAGEIVTLPFYGDARVDTAAAALDTQTDGLNIRDLQPAGNGEDHAYFGAFLDFNQTAPRFPNHPVPENGPWNSGLKSIQELIRGLHQCLVAEVFFTGDPIDPGATPAGSDNLAQRNLVISESDNPGSLATHTVQHTFEIKATRPAPQVVVEPAQGGFEEATTTVTRVVEAGPDELMIRWHDLPRETRMTIYMPDVDVFDVVRRAGQTQEALRLEAVDAHTLLCAAGDVTFIPLPEGRTRNTPALLTLELPDGVRRGQEFRATVHQVSGRPRRILGAFELTVPVSDKSVLLAPEIRKLSVLRHIHRAIPQEDPWHAVFTRYTGQIAERVRGFGGDPDRVVPAADGSGRDEAAERCARKGWLFGGLLGLMVVLAGLHPLLGLAGAVLAAVAGALWAGSCHPSRCRWIMAALSGVAFGAAGLALLTFLGLTGPGAPAVLGGAAVVLGGLAALGVRFRCFRLGAP